MGRCQRGERNARDAFRDVRRMLGDRSHHHSHETRGHSHDCHSLTNTADIGDVSNREADIDPSIDQLADVDSVAEVAEARATEIADREEVGDFIDSTVNQDRPTEVNDQVKIERYVEGETRFIVVDAGGFAEVEIGFDGECWVEIDDGKGDSIYGDLNRADDLLRVFGEPPIKILFGKATVVSVKFNGEDIDLRRYITRAETAKVTLGG